MKTVLLAAAVLSLAGCYASGDARVGVVAPAPVVVVEAPEPPPPQQEVIVERPGMIWIEGHWNWEGGRYVWHKGYHERVREGYRWERGHYGARHVWVEGHWAH